MLVRVLNLHRDKKNVGENRRETGISLVTQDAAHKGFCWTFPLYRPSRSLEQFRTQGLESTAVQSGVLVRALNFHRDEKKRWREPGRDGKFLSNTGFYA